MWEWTTWKRPLKIQGKNKNRVILVYGPFNKGHPQPQWAHPFGKEPSLLPGFSPQKSPALSHSSCSGHGIPQGNIQRPDSPKFSWQQSAFKCYGQTEFITLALPGKAQKILSATAPRAPSLLRWLLQVRRKDWVAKNSIPRKRTVPEGAQLIMGV